MQVAQCLVLIAGTGSTSDVVLSSSEVTLLQSQQSQVGISLGKVGILLASLLQPLLSLTVVTIVNGQSAQVVIGTGIRRILLDSRTVDVLLLGCGLGYRGGIQQLFDAQLAGIGLQLVLNLLVATSHRLVVDGQTGTAQFRQNTIGQLLEAVTHVLDLLLTLLRILIH